MKNKKEYKRKKREQFISPEQKVVIDLLTLARRLALLRFFIYVNLIKI